MRVTRLVDSRAGEKRAGYGVMIMPLSSLQRGRSGAPKASEAMRSRKSESAIRCIQFPPIRSSRDVRNGEEKTTIRCGKQRASSCKNCRWNRASPAKCPRAVEIGESDDYTTPHPFHGDAIALAVHSTFPAMMIESALLPTESIVNGRSFGI